MEKYMDFRPPKRGTRFILVVPRADQGSAIQGRPAAYIGIDDMMFTYSDTEKKNLLCIVGLRKAEAGENEVVCQLPAGAEYQVFLKSDVEFLDPEEMNRKHFEFDVRMTQLRKEVYEKSPSLKAQMESQEKRAALFAAQEAPEQSGPVREPGQYL